MFKKSQMIKKIILFFMIFSPFLSFAVGTNKNFKEFVEGLYYQFLPGVINVILALAVLFFLWSAVSLILNSSATEEKRREKVNRLVFSVLALFVMFSLWALVSFLKSPFDDLLDNKVNDKWGTVLINN